MPHDMPQHGYLLPGSLQHLIHHCRFGAVRRQIDNLGRELTAGLFFNASSYGRADSSGGVEGEKRRGN